MAQNVTISLDDDLIREAKHLAVDRGMSLSKLVASILEEQLSEQRRRYEEATSPQLALMKKGLDLGFNGHITWTRDELHER